MMALANRLQTPELAFSISALACLGSSLLCAWLPEAEADPTWEAVIRTAP